MIRNSKSCYVAFSRIASCLSQGFGYNSAMGKQGKATTDKPEQSIQCQTLHFFSPSTKQWKEALDGSEDKKEIERELLSSLQMHNLVVLAGSGTSIFAGGPTMKDLWAHCLDEKKTELKLPAKLENCRDNSEGNIERFLSLCEASIECEMDQEKKAEIEDFIKSCRDVIRFQCSKFLLIDINPENKLEPHCLFLHKLIRRRVRDPRLKVFTTNYDLCFEDAAAMIGLPVIDGFSFSFPNTFDPRYFDYDIVKRSRLSDERGDYLEGVFHLYKLHGSVNWYRESDGRIKKNGLENKDDVDYCMIYPAKGKFQQSYAQPYIETISRFMSVLREPNTCLLVVGFGFNDDHLSEPILSAIKNNPHMKIVIIDLKAKDNYCHPEQGNSNLFQRELYRRVSNGMKNIILVNSSFHQFAQCIPDLKALSKGEEIEQFICDVVRPRSEQ